MSVKAARLSARLLGRVGARRCVVLGVAVLLCMTSSVAARSHRGSDEKRGAQTVEQEKAEQAGLAALDAGRFAIAEQAFLRAYATEQHPLLLFLLGRLASARGQGLLARDLMRRYLQDPEREDSRPRQELAELLVAEPPPSGVALGELAITGPRGAWVRVDGQPMGVLPLLSPLQVPAGAHAVLLERGSRRLTGEALVTAGFPAEVRFDAESRTVFSSAPPPLVALLSLPAQDSRGALESRLYSSLRAAAKAEGVLLQTRQEALQTAADLESCLDKLNCQLDLGSRSDAFGVLSLRVDSPGNADANAAGRYVLQAQFVDVLAGQSLSLLRETCDACDASQLAEHVTQLALRSYRDAWLRPRGRLTLSVRPPDAQVLVNGRRFQHWPLLLAPLAGSSRIEASAPGYRRSDRTVTLRENQVSAIEVVLESAADGSISVAGAGPTASGAVRSRVLFFGGLAALGTGILLSGFGVSGLAVHGQCGSSDPMGTICSQIYDTRAKGGALLGVGLGLSIVGTLGIVFGRDAVQRKTNEHANRMGVSAGLPDRL